MLQAGIDIKTFHFDITRYVNRQKRSVGHLFQGRYEAILVDADSCLLELSTGDKAS